MSQRKPADSKAPSPQQRLNSWKEIAAHLGVAVRTVQRWEAAEGLPVRRHRHAQLSSAYAYSDELDRWWDSRPDAGRRKRRASAPEPSPSGTRDPAPSIVVLPFANLDRDEETEILSDGLTEDLITALSQIQPLRVVARSSAFFFKGKAHDVREIGARLGVGNVLEGSLRRAGKRLRVTAQLVSAADGCHLWAQRFDREMEDPFDLQERLAQAIAAGLRVQLLGEASVRRPTRDTETYNAFLRGRFFWNQRRPDALQRALRCFEDAIEREPDFALGHAGIAECHVFEWVYAKAPWHEVIPAAKAAAARASQIDATLSGIHTSLGLVRIASFEMQGAEAAFRRALELNAGDHRARHWHAMVLASLGRCGEAIPEIELALELDPLGVNINQDAGRILYLARRYDEAIARLRHTLEIAPKNYWARVYLALAYIQTGDYQQALTAAAVEPALVALVRGRMGETAAVPKALEMERPAGPSFTWKAVLHLALGQQRQAIQSLQCAHERFEPELLDLCLPGHPLFDELSATREFEALLPR
jgi:TolB-like protein/tetratricopeptide (TPR) repeat protein